MSTASGLERELQCPASAVLSPVIRESREDAERGHELHTFCRSVIAGTPRELALAAISNPQWRETAEHIDFAILCGGVLRIRAEVAYRLNTETDEVMELGLNLNRRYPSRAAHEIDGTNDFEGYLPSGMPVVVDIKTGWLLVTACHLNPQMRFHARALMLKLDVEKVMARIAYVAVDGQIGFDTHIFTRLELDVFGDELVARRARIERANEMLRTTGRVEVHANPAWCRWCPAKDGCPKFTTLARAMLPELRETHERWGKLTDEQKATAYLMAVEAKDLADRIVESMKEIARTDPIDLPGNKVLRDTGAGVRIVNAERSLRRRRVA